jgi:hypothetical protein
MERERRKGPRDRRSTDTVVETGRLVKPIVGAEGAGTVSKGAAQGKPVPKTEPISEAEKKRQKMVFANREEMEKVRNPPQPTGEWVWWTNLQAWYRRSKSALLRKIGHITQEEEINNVLDKHEERKE